MTESGSFRLPSDDFEQAWLHVLMAFVLFANRDACSASQHIWSAFKLLDKCVLRLTKDLRACDIRSVEYCPPEGIAAICLHQLAKGDVDEYKDYADAYEQTVVKLDKQMMRDPLQRSYQDTIRNIKHDIQALVEMLDGQLMVWGRMSAAHQDENDEDPSNKKMEDTLPLLGPSPMEGLLSTGRADLLTRKQCLQPLHARLDMLADWHRTAIASNKDQQEAAVTVFTMATVIFLPLSWVASIFGMNSVDIRELRFGQWLYWIVAVPLTVFIVWLAWWWAGAGKLDYLRRRKARMELCRPPDVQGHFLKPSGKQGAYGGKGKGVYAPNRAEETTPPAVDPTTAGSEEEKQPPKWSARRGTCTTDTLDV